MSSISRPIPTNLILGFLGVGKTTAILDLLRQKPEGETWAVLVNEFGEVGIDGAILETEGAVVREVPGGLHVLRRGAAHADRPEPADCQSQAGSSAD